MAADKPLPAFEDPQKRMWFLCPKCDQILRQAEALGEKGGPPFCPSCGERLFTSALKKVDAVYIEPEPETAAPLARPKPTVAEFLRRIADDLDAHRAQTSGTDFTFERLRIQGPGYNLFVGRWDPHLHHPHRYVTWKKNSSR